MRRRTELGADRWISAEVAGSGPDVLLLHGIPGSSAVWRGVAERLSARHRAIAPDLVGFGESARTRDVRELWADAQADAVLALLDDLGATRVLLVGHDYGGPVAAHLLAKAPGRFAAVLLASTNAFGDTPIEFPLSGIFWPGVGRLWARLLFSAPSLRMMLRQGAGRGSPRLDPDDHVGDPAQALAIRAIFETALRELAPRYAPVTAALGAVRVPARVVWGEKDPLFPLPQARRTAALLPGADLLLLAGAGHFLPGERPAELAEAIEGLWGRARVAPPAQAGGSP